MTKVSKGIKNYISKRLDMFKIHYLSSLLNEATQNKFVNADTPLETRISLDCF